MPWVTKALLKLKGELETAIENEFGVSPKCPVLLCTSEELVTRIQSEPFFFRLPEEERTILNRQLQFICGKYFDDTQEIWVIHGRGDKDWVIFHELLHSIQKCKPNRERIVDYLTWHYTKESDIIDSSQLEDWQEIERSVGLTKIKQRLLMEGDCEES